MHLLVSSQQRRVPSLSSVSSPPVSISGLASELLLEQGAGGLILTVVPEEYLGMKRISTPSSAELSITRLQTYPV